MQHIKQVILSEVIVGEQMKLTIAEFQDKYAIDESFFNELLDHDLLPETKKDSENVYLDLHAMRRIQAAKRLQHDLEINMAGIAVVLDLREELEQLQHELAILRKHLGG